jgi:hypothetical protein
MATSAAATPFAPLKENEVISGENIPIDAGIGQRIYEFSEGNKNDREILGVRGWLFLFC